MVDLNGVRLRSRTLASASLVGYGAPPASRLIPYGLSPVARFLPMERLGAVTTRTLTLEPRDGHFSTAHRLAGARLAGDAAGSTTVPCGGSTAAG